MMVWVVMLINRVMHVHGLFLKLLCKILHPCRTGFRWQYEDGEGVFRVLHVFPFHHVGGYDFDYILEGAESACELLR